MATRSLLTFADLLAPFSAQAFFKESWEKEPFHIQERRPEFYDGLLTTRDVETAISSGGLRYPAIQLARDGVFFPAEAFTRNSRSGDDVFTGIPNLERIRAEYEAGATISLPAFHRASKPLGALAARMEEEFDHAVHANVYLTPANAAGFAPHYDTHEVFVLQIAGRKRWRVQESSLSLPHRSQPYDPHSAVSSAPARELELAPGDLLYLPRGFVHSTVTSRSFSLHVTIGVTVYTWVDLLAEWAQSSRTQPSLRRALPPGFASGEEARRAVRDQLPRLIAELQRITGYDALLEGFSHRVRSTSARTPAQFHADVAAIGPRTRFRCPDADHYTLSDDNGRLALAFNGRVLLLDGGVRSTLEEMRRRPTFSAVEVSQHLGQEAALAFVRSLHREGFLSTTTATEPSSS